MRPAVPFSLDRAATTSLAEQIHLGVRAAIRDGRLQSGARLPSWRDLATQLGVARGTVRLAYERLADEQFVTACGPAGTFVADHIPPAPSSAPLGVGADSRLRLEPDSVYGARPLPFQMGVPAHDAFPTALWSRLSTRAAREVAARGVFMPIPQGEPVLRREIAAHLSISRGLSCSVEQIFITSGYAGAMGLALRALPCQSGLAWMEDPGFPFGRRALELSGLVPTAVPVDDEGLVVEAGIAAAPHASLALVTSGQQAPLGMALAPRRRRELLVWAEASGAWVLDDDYLSELQLAGRAAPALASLDRAGRVVHIGSFSKTLNPALRLGFVVVPESLVGRFADVSATMAPAASVSVQSAVADFLRGGHYLRHLRRMKQLYVQRRDVLKSTLEPELPVDAMAGLAVLIRLPSHVDDTAVAALAHARGLAPVPFSPWHMPEPARSAGAVPQGLLLGVANVLPERAAEHCSSLSRIIAQVRMAS